ncbi:MAG: ABC transporter permease [Anaerolineaceae bacterium]
MSGGTLARKTLPLGLTLWVVATLNFALPRLAPGDPLDYMLGDEVHTLAPQQRAAARDEFGLNAPLAVQYGEYVRGLLTGDLGRSTSYGRPVAGLLAERAGRTAILVLPAAILSFVAGTILGAIAAWNRGRPGEASLLAGILLLDAMPAFWVGMLFIATFALELGWLPSFGALPPGGADGFAVFTEGGKRLIMPMTVIVLATVGHTFLVARAAVTSTLGEDYVQMAQAKGLSTRDVLFRHALRAAMLPVLTSFAVTVGGLAGGAVVVETVFAYPGLGRLVFDAVRARDYPLLQGAFLLFAASVILANWLAELSYPRLDPRVRLEVE